MRVERKQLSDEEKQGERCKEGNSRGMKEEEKWSAEEKQRGKRKPIGFVTKF